MEVPCCGGLVSAVKEAMLESKTIVPYSEVVITTDGKITVGKLELMPIADAENDLKAILGE